MKIINNSPLPPTPNYSSILSRLLASCMQRQACQRPTALALLSVPVVVQRASELGLGHLMPLCNEGAASSAAAEFVSPNSVRTAAPDRHVGVGGIGGSGGHVGGSCNSSRGNNGSSGSGGGRGDGGAGGSCASAGGGGAHGKQSTRLRSSSDSPYPLWNSPPLALQGGGSHGAKFPTAFQAQQTPFQMQQPSFHYQPELHPQLQQDHEQQQHHHQYNHCGISLSGISRSNTTEPEPSQPLHAPTRSITEPVGLGIARQRGSHQLAMSADERPCGHRRHNSNGDAIGGDVAKVSWDIRPVCAEKGKRNQALRKSWHALSHTVMSEEAEFGVSSVPPCSHATPRSLRRESGQYASGGIAAYASGASCIADSSGGSGGSGSGSGAGAGSGGGLTASNRGRTSGQFANGGAGSGSKPTGASTSFGSSDSPGSSGCSSCESSAPVTPPNLWAKRRGSLDHSPDDRPEKLNLLSLDEGNRMKARVRPIRMMAHFTLLCYAAR